MCKLDELLCQLTPKLKKLGYCKNRLTWYKNQGKLSVIFSVQKSQYSEDTWYYAFGICLHDITQKKPNSISACQIYYRVEQNLTADGVANLLDSWEKRYANGAQLRRLAVEGNLPGIVSQDAVRYLTMVDITKI